MKRLLPALAVIVAVIAWQQFRDAPDAADIPAAAVESLHGGEAITGEGTVVRILADDNDGSRHQRFILELESGRSFD